jgi:hypothetical protein
LLLVACEETRTVELGFGAGARTPIGFRCRDDEGRFIVTRAIRERKLRFSLLVEFVSLQGGLPSCRAGDIAAFCEDHSCTALSTPARTCLDFEKDLTGTENAIQIIGETLRTLEGPVASDAPHEPVIVRAVATAQYPCSAVIAYDPAQLIGCALSCPVQLGGVEGEVLLDLPTLSDTCATGVVACATGEWGK